MEPESSLRGARLGLSGLGQDKFTVTGWGSSSTSQLVRFKKINRFRGEKKGKLRDKPSLRNIELVLFFLPTVLMLRC